MMANYTMELHELVNNPLINVFDFDYPFYENDELKQAFEQKFIEHYYFYEIGFETPERFKHHLKSQLRLKMPYYKQLYQTELEARNINFLLNKDLKETFIREVTNEATEKGTSSSNQNSNTDGTNTTTSNSTMNGSSNETKTDTTSGNSSSTTSGTTSGNHQESMIRDGVASATLESGLLTGVSKDGGTSSQETTSEQSQSGNTTLSGTQSNETTDTQSQSSLIKAEQKATGQSEQNRKESSVEKTDLLSQGNIGVTSSAQLLKEWRQVLINMDEIIINDCKSLFMQIY